MVAVDSTTVELKGGEEEGTMASNIKRAQRYTYAWIEILCL